MMYTQMDIDLDVITEDCRKVSDRLPEGTGIIAVVKADAYGLGAIPIARKLEKAGYPMFVVTFTEEAVKLREAGIRVPILVMMPIESKELPIAGKHKLIITITGYEMAKQILDELVKQSYNLPTHLKADHGLGRVGIVLKNRLEEVAEEAAKIYALPNLNTETVFSHLTAAGIEGTYTALDLAEQQGFFELIKMLKRRNISIKTYLMSSDPYI